MYVWKYMVYGTSGRDPHVCTVSCVRMSYRTIMSETGSEEDKGCQCVWWRPAAPSMAIVRSYVCCSCLVGAAAAAGRRRETIERRRGGREAVWVSNPGKTIRAGV